MHNCGTLLLAGLLCWPAHLAIAQDVAGGYDRQPLQQLTEFRKQHRRTFDGRLCAAAFVQEDHTYTDCTDARAPDGSIGRGEWCYVEVQLLGKGLKDWGYCIPPIDYDKVRMKVREAFEMKEAEAEKMIARLDGSSKRVSDMMSRFNSVCGARHDSLTSRVDKSTEILEKAEKSLKKIESTSAQIEMVKNAMGEVRAEISRHRAFAFTKPENCERIAGYEDEPFPDGLRGAVYDNGQFEGTPKGYRKDSPVDFLFTGAGPVEGVPSHKYSIRWDGYIKAPHSGQFIFSTVTDSGVRVFLNDENIISDRMPKGSSADAYGNKKVPFLATIAKSGIHKTISVPVELTGNQKYKIRIEMVHSHHFKYDNADSSSIKLMWKSAQIREQVVPSKYFFSSNPPMPVKFLSLDPQLLQISLLYDGEQAFADSSQFFIADVPEKFKGLRMIRTIAEPTMDYFEVTVNVPTNIYVASPKDEPLPLAPFEDHIWKAHDTNYNISVYRGTDPLGRAIENTILGLRMISHREGGRISFQVMEKYTPFILIFEEKREEVSSCGGEQKNLSLVGGDEYADCEASSEQSEAFGCESALNGRHVDQKFGSWRTSTGNGVGEYITARFKRPVQITHFKFKPRSDPATWPSEITLTYSEEDEDEGESFAILHTSSMEHNTYVLRRPIITNYVKAEITRMYLNGEDSGGSFEFLGTVCSADDSKNEEKLKVIEINDCEMTVENIPDLLPIAEGEQFIAICPRSCVINPEGAVYGAGTYATESTLCTAGVHAGACEGVIDQCRLLVTVAGPKKSFPAVKLNGVSSQSHGPANASISVSKSSCTEAILSKDKINYKISFRGDGSQPEGWLVDDGSIKHQKNGLFYGWLRQAPAVSCNASMFSNPINNGGIYFPPASASRDCLEGADCSSNFWSISLPENGKYRVEVLVGNPCEPKEGSLKNFIQVNDIPLIRGVALERESLFTAVTNVNVTDKLILISSECEETGDSEDLCRDAVTSIMAITIEKIEE